MTDFKAQDRIGNLLPHLFRQEYARMTAFLCRHFGLNDIDTAEDLAAETFLKASEYWALHGVPANPVAWLYLVAKNKAKDNRKRLTAFENRVSVKLSADHDYAEADEFLEEHLIADSALAMIFAVCNPANSKPAQICLALQILCGFNVDEIADALLLKRETVKKQLYRARNNLRKNKFDLGPLSAETIQARLDAVLQTLYLLFNEGYFSNSNSTQVRTELCFEAMRLTLALIENPLTNLPSTNALLALMCYQASRLAARTGTCTNSVVYDEQDRSSWDQDLINRGNYYLVQATERGEISSYHLQAGIAYWHTAQSEADKWPHILQLYDQLVATAHSPVAALSRIFALARVHGKPAAIREAQKIDQSDRSDYHQLLGYLYEDLDSTLALTHYHTALSLLKPGAAKQLLEHKISKLEAFERQKNAFKL